MSLVEGRPLILRMSISKLIILNRSKIVENLQFSKMKAKLEDSSDKTLTRTEPSSKKFVISLEQCSNNWKKIEKAVTKRNETRRKFRKNVVVVEAKKPDIWFDVDRIFIPKDEEEKKVVVQSEEVKTQEAVVKANAKLTRAIAIDCEMVGVGEDGRDSILARVSLVNQLNECVYDKYVLPTERVTDYRTHVSGIRPDDLKKGNGAEKFEVVQREVSDILKDRILVGHAVHNDLKILFLDHPKKKLRDTQKCKLFRKLKPSLGGIPSLRNLAQSLLGITIQDGEHSSVVDAQATMRIYTMYRKQWEMEIRTKKHKEKVDAIDDLVLKQELISKTGNDTHKRYIERKLKGRGKPMNFKKRFK